jgi:flagellar biosynthesis protein
MKKNRPPPAPEMAVALRYDGTGAPRVTAKGRGLVAEEIIRRAREHDVPLNENPELVKLLARVDLGDEIPEALYVACAQIISFAYYLKGKGIPGRRPAG